MDTKKNDRNLDKTLCIRVSDSLFRNIREISAENGICHSALLRTVLQNELGSYRKVLLELSC